MNPDSPLVSIVIPVYNGGAHLLAAVQTALTQEYANLEVVVIDNGSTDGCADSVRALDDDRVTIHRYDELVPAAQNWNRAIEAAKGEYVKLLCADDLLEPGCIRRQAQLLDNNPDCGMVAGRRRLISEDGGVIKQQWGLGGLSARVPGHVAISRCLRAGGNIFGEPAAVMFRTPLAQAALPWQEEAGYVVDVDLYVRVLVETDLWADPHVVASFRVST
jgi:glycosyltransferase involved in cell wall biosynthesis